MSEPVSGELLNLRRAARVCLRCGQWPALAQPYLCANCVQSENGTAAWEGGEAACQHRGRVKPRQDIPVREVCTCGARRVETEQPA